MIIPVTHLALCFAAGILLGHVFLLFPWTAAILALASAGAVIVRSRAAGTPTIRALQACVAALSGAALTVVSVAYQPADHYGHAAVIDGVRRTVSGVIASPLDRDPDRTAFLLQAERIDGAPVSGILRVSARGEHPPVGLGDRITVSGKLRPARGYRNPGGFDYPAFLARQGVHAVLSAGRDGGIRIDERGSGLLRHMQDLRERIRQAFLRSVSGDGAAVLLAMVLGEEGGLTDALRERFMAAGVTHILSISGSHLGLVAVLCFWLVRKGLFLLLPERRYHQLTLHADPRKLAAAATVLPVVFYAFLAGGQTATLRALIMILTGLAAVLLDRDGDLLNALAVAALITLVPDPQALLDISFQLSYCSVLCILFVVRTWDGLALSADTPVRQWRNKALLLLVISAATTLATAPLTAHYFRQASPAGVLANMLVVPFAGAVIVPLGLCSGLLSLATGSLPLAGLNQAAADAFVSLVSFFSRLPGAGVALPSPGVLFAAGYAGLLAGGGIALRGRLLSRLRPLEFSGRMSRTLKAVLALSAAALTASLALPLLRQAENSVTFLDVGQGDCALIETAEGKRLLIDGGGARENRFDVGRRVVAPFLADRGIRTLDLVVLSHPHPDHMNGLISLLGTVRAREVWWAGLDGNLEGFDSLRDLLAAQAIPLRAVRSGDGGQYGEAAVEVLSPLRHPPEGERRAYAAENSRSLVVRLRLDGAAFLFPGDIHRDGERALADAADLSAEVLKVPHHGSKTSSSDEFLRAVRPRIAVVSVGADNPYRQPSEEVVERYGERGIRLFRTDRDGAVRVTVRRNGCEVVPWASLLLRTIPVTQPLQWGAIERENAKKLWLRKGAT
jgi:competence protein ComEC